MTRLLVCTGLLLLLSSVCSAQDEEPQEARLELSVPLLEGQVAPFTGLLITESHAVQCIEDAAAVDRLTLEVSIRTRELELSSTLRDAFIAEQRTRIEELSRRSWWDENGNIFMLGLGLIVGVAASALVAGLATN